MFFGILILGSIEKLNLPYFIITFILFLYQAFAIKQCNLSNHHQCLIFFKKTPILIAIFLMAIILS
jgi:hypothetical protein